MDDNVRRKVKELAEALVASEEYRKLRDARDEIAKHQAAQIMLRDFLTKQQRLQEKVMRGEQPTEADVAEYEQTAQVVSINPYVRRLLEAEMQFGQVMVDVQRELAEAVGVGLPELPEMEAQVQAEAPPQPSARSRLWVPGQG